MLPIAQAQKTSIPLYPEDSICTLVYSRQRNKYSKERKRLLGFHMTHYDIEQWADYSRDLGEAEERGRMHDHLAGGCEKCGGLSTLSTRLVVICGGLNSAEVPEYALRLARAIFPVRVQE